jgi:hypothetical protein
MTADDLFGSDQLFPQQPSHYRFSHYATADEGQARSLKWVTFFTVYHYFRVCHIPSTAQLLERLFDKISGPKFCCEHSAA